MDVKILRRHADAKIPAQACANDFGYDVTAVSVEKVGFLTYKYHLGISLQIVRDKNIHGNIAIALKPRSSVWKSGMLLSNSTGTIDEGYTGEISAVYYHIFPWKKKYKAGDRVGQLHIVRAPRMQFVEVDTLDQTERGEGGYGHSGL